MPEASLMRFLAIVILIIWAVAWPLSGVIVNWIDNYKPKEGKQHGE